MTEYETAINTFKLKYNALPGDINNATTFWPTECLDHPSFSSRTCDGNNNKIIDNVEGFRVWQHLSLAGLIDGSYDGYQTLTSTTESTYPYFFNVITRFNYYTVVNRAGYSLETKHGIGLSVEDASISESEMYRVDLKYDDGEADSGKIWLALGDPSADCLSPGTLDYDLTNSTAKEDCFFLWWYD